MPLEVVTTLRELIRRPSINPMSKDVPSDTLFEQPVTEYVNSLLESMDVTIYRQQVAKNRTNLVARLDGSTPVSEGGKVLVLEAHQDTVPVTGMTIDPFGAELREDRIWGRGACDVKSGIACILTVLSRLAEERPVPRPTVIVACTVDEEFGVTGARSFPEMWTDPATLNLPRVPDAIIVSEPTELEVVVAHKGTLRWKCQTHGRAAHSSRPQEGESAIYHMAKVINATQEYANTVVGQLASHPLVDSPTLSIGRVEGGISVNVVPDSCTIEIDRRIVPGENWEVAFEHFKNFLTVQVPDVTVTHGQPYSTTPGMSDQINEQLSSHLSNVIQEHGYSGARVGVTYGTNAWAYAAREAPTVVFGPGSIQQAHTVDEWIEIEQLHLATDILYTFALQFGH
ncbi:MAG: M20 family metallopeptidase [Planctomycetota bacterium]|nr:M20 family metallopeptidase [Planctomycetota bacterium]